MAWNGRMKIDLEEQTEDFHHLNTLVSEKRGAVIICSHLGNIEILRAFTTSESGRSLPEFGLISIVDFSGAARFNTLMKKVNPNSMLHLVDANEISGSTVIYLRSRLALGDVVVIAGDRTSRKNANRVEKFSFLGESATFPQGVFFLALMLESPIFYAFLLRNDDRDPLSPYRLYLHLSSVGLTHSKKDRQKKLSIVMEEFISHLESLTQKHPYQWYNFFDFWNSEDENSSSKLSEKSDNI